MTLLHKLSALGAAAAAACLWYGAEAYAQGAYQPPPGSYRQSCQNIRVEGSILRAACTNIAGNRVAASIDLAVCRNRTLDNDNGVLRCGAPYTPVPAPQVQRPPVGSYQASCREATLRGSILSARCTTMAGAVVNATLDVNTCGGREIYNDNGVLRCSATMPQQLPGGSWLNSCRDGAVRGNVLTARCTRAGSAPVTSSLDLSTCRTREAVNENGYLRCAAPAQQTRLPEGSYQASCRDAFVRNNVLTARCTRSDRTTVVSTLDLAACRDRDIYNANGVLRCGGPLQAQLPEGSYQETCRDASVRGTILSARCTRRNGPAVVSSLDLNTCRNRDIVNANGILQCGDNAGRGRGRGQRDDFEAVLYTGPNFRGQQILVTEDIPNLAARTGFNDAVRSIRVLRGSLEVCIDPNYGRCVVIDESMAELDGLRMDRAISSVRSGEVGPGRGRGRGF